MDAPWTHEEDIEHNLLTVTPSTDETDRVVQDPVADLSGDDLVDKTGRRWKHPLGALVRRQSRSASSCIESKTSSSAPQPVVR